MTWLARHAESMLLPLLVVALILLLANLSKYHDAIALWLSTNREILAAINSTISLTVVSVGSVLAYFRFFKGRTFSSRAQVDVKVDVLATPENVNYHVVTITVTNIGTLSIWDPKPIVRVTKIGPDGETIENLVHWRESVRPLGKSSDLTVIDSAERAYFVAFVPIDKLTWIVDYDVFIESHSELWKGGATVSNLRASKE